LPAPQKRNADRGCKKECAQHSGLNSGKFHASPFERFLKRLQGAEISSPDIRAGMALLIAALVAKGRTTIHNAQQIDRGYQRVEERLGAVGAAISRVDVPGPG